MKIRIVVPALLLAMASICYGQAVPAGGNNTPISAIGSTPLLPSLDGVLHYALNGSEIYAVWVLWGRQYDLFDGALRRRWLYR